MNHLTNTPFIPQNIVPGTRLTKELIAKFLKTGGKTVAEFSKFLKARESTLETRIHQSIKLKHLGISS